ncbi:MAG: 3'(2'),5'-bisphosphate nucleotidase CysQ [Candidatus Kuenenia sp.]|nr:3'(2'),5'-bisphosphate nucleotidase CysQ [Candidatus Kuenenia hertensis]
MINLKEIIKIAIAAGDQIIAIYNNDTAAVAYKEDNSPLTLADEASNKVIFEALSNLYPEIPVLSEEGKGIPFHNRNTWDYFWLVDPLDGTKEFIKKNGEFTVNIALIKKNKPVLGVIYVPVKREIYFAQERIGAYKFEEIDRFEELGSVEELILSSRKLPEDSHTTNAKYTVVGSRSHMSKETKEYIDSIRQIHGEVETISAGSSLKFCLVAEAKADIYPRFGPTMEWDTAAGHIIVEEAGGKIIAAESKLPLEYNKETLLNPWFIVSR